MLIRPRLQSWPSKLAASWPANMFAGPPTGKLLAVCAAGQLPRERVTLGEKLAVKMADLGRLLAAPIGCNRSASS